MNEREYREEVAFLEECARQYYLDPFHEGVLSDYEFDTRRRIVQNYEIAKGILDTERFSNKVGAKPAVNESAITRKHSKQRKSLENALNKTEAREWLERWANAFGKRVDLVAEYKLDGAATVLRYMDGRLVLGLTRGDGETGEDITSHVEAYAPKTIDALGEVEVEGETVISFRELRIVQPWGKEYTSCRAAAAGMLMQKETTPKHRHLRFIPYGITMDGTEGMTQSDKLRLLRELGFMTETFHACTPESADEMFTEMVSRQGYISSFDCDGVVFKINDPDKQSIMGETNHSPRWAFAYKKPPVTEPCTLLGVDFQIGRGGEVSPVARITPTKLLGAVVTSAYLHSEKKMKERGGIHIGSVYEIYRSGDVIPHLGDCITRKPDSEEVTFPTKCPVCGSAVEKSGETYYCSKRGMCPGAMEAKAIYAVSREALDIDGLGEVMIRNLIKEGYIKNVADVYDLTHENLVSAGCGPSVASSILQEINNSRDVAPYRFLLALSIPLVGKATARSIAGHLGAVKDFLTWTDAKDIIAKKISDVGPGTASQIATYLSNDQAAKLAERLLSNSNVTGQEEIRQGATYVGITDRRFVFTGSFSKPKEVLEEMVIARGGAVSSVVSASTSYVVRGDKPGKKLQTANAFGVPVIDEAEFLHRVYNCVVIGKY